MKKVSKTNGPAIDSSELIIAMDELEKEKGIKKDYLLEAIETALVTAYKRNFDSAENVRITMDKETGEIHDERTCYFPKTANSPAQEPFPMPACHFIQFRRALFAHFPFMPRP